MTQTSFGGDWTREKLHILQGYLDAYTSVLKNQPFTLTYVDAFAGEGFWRPSGLYNGKDYSDFLSLLAGSAKLALDVSEKPFDKLVFIEKNQQRSDSLMGLRREYPHREINVLNQDANTVLPLIARRLGDFDRAVVFLDPFATQVSWSTVAALAGTQKIDCWILFPVGAVARMLPTAGLPLPQWHDSLDRIFGGREHWEDFYQDSEQLSLFEEQPRQGRQRGSHQIAERYRARLASVFHQVAQTPRSLRNSTNSPMFELFFAASNPRGAPIAIDIADHLLKNW